MNNSATNFITNLKNELAAVGIKLNPRSGFSFTVEGLDAALAEMLVRTINVISGIKLIIKRTLSGRLYVSAF